jgi:hypothetical protein
MELEELAEPAGPIPEAPEYALDSDPAPEWVDAYEI